MKIHPLFAAAAIALSALTAQAHEFKAGAITIGHPYARATAAGQPVGGGFLKLVNNGSSADRLVSASAAVSTTVELHEMKMDGDVMKMRQVDSIALQPGQTVELKPGSFHMMFMGLKAPLKAGAEFPLKLKFEKAGDVTVMVHVEEAGTDHSAHKP